MRRIQQLLAGGMLAAGMTSPVQAETVLSEWGTVSAAFSGPCAAPCDSLSAALALFDPSAGFDSVLRHTAPGRRFHCWVWRQKPAKAIVSGKNTSTCSLALAGESWCHSDPGTRQGF